jgi:hypothetical protein
VAVCLKTDGKEKEARYAHRLMQRPEFLRLDRLDCTGLHIFGKVQLSKSSLGYKIDLLNNKWIELEPMKALEPTPTMLKNRLSIADPIGVLASGTGSSNLVWGIGATNDKKNSSWEITLDDVFVSQQELDRVRQLVRKAAGTDQHGAIPQRLKDMIEAYHLFWAGTDRDDPRTYPSKEKVVTWFMSKDFDKTPAEAAATLIAPEGIKNIGRPEKIRPSQRTISANSKTA